MDKGKESGLGLMLKHWHPLMQRCRGRDTLSSAVKVFSAIELGCWGEIHLGQGLPYIIELIHNSHHIGCFIAVYLEVP